MNADARRENMRALAVAAGLSDEEAALRLDKAVLITFDPADVLASRLAGEVIPILSRTLEVSCDEGAGVSYAAELVMGRCTPRASCPRVFALLLGDRCFISSRPGDAAGVPGPLPHPLMIQLAACYVAGAAIRRAVGDGIPNVSRRDFTVPFDAFIDKMVDLSAPVDLGEAYLAGAGAIGNGFLWAARHVRVEGRLHVVDDDVVSFGNLQRQIWFEEADVGKPKAERLCEKARPLLAGCLLEPSTTRLQEHKNRSDGPWLRRLIVAVDSRRARRHLQNELPGEVLDASTTGSKEVVLHYSRRPSDLACMGCVYHRNDIELTHEAAVAAHLGVDVGALRTERIDPATARRICESHPHLSAESITGLAFDTLYKQLCGSGLLRAAGGEQVVAPFAFISVLAGTLLLIELIRRQHMIEADFTNDWRVDPWQGPVPEMRQRRPRRDTCECCGRREIQDANAALWGGSMNVGQPSRI